MVVSLIKSKQMYSITLPVKVKGQFWITDFDDYKKPRDLISIEAINGDWIVKSNKKVTLLDINSKVIQSELLKPLSFFNLKVKNSDERIVLFAEPISESRQSFKKIVVKSSCQISIGRTNDNNICFENKFVSGKQAKLFFDGNDWSIQDLESTNGTFVNGFRIEQKKLNAGDFIYIMGLKIVVGKSFFAINNPEGTVIINSSELIDFIPQPVEQVLEKDEEEKDDYFYRSPRFKREIETAAIKIDAPPALQKQDQVPLPLMLGPAITMGLTSASTGLLTLANVISTGGKIQTALPSLFMSFGMLLGTILWPILTKKYEKKMRIKNEKKRQVKYLAYLDSIRDEIKNKCKEQIEILTENIIPTDECIDRVLNVKRNLWERVIGQIDFLRLRLGCGDLAFDAQIAFPEKKFTLDDDSLQDALFSLGDEPKDLLNVPVSISFVDNYITGVIGNRKNVINLLRSLLLQMVSLHSYDELKFVFIIDKEEMEEWDFVKWFPHSWNNEKTARYLATDVDEVKELAVFMEKNIVARGDEEKTDYSTFIPYYVIISASRDLADKCEAFGQLLKYKNNRAFSIITLYDEIKNLPKEAKSVIEINDTQSKIFDKDDISGKCQTFFAEGIEKEKIDKVAMEIANIRMDLTSQRFALPNMVTFLEMFNVSKIEHLNPLTRWKENNPTISLQTPIGVDTFGEPFLLDLHEKFHGPHGLVAGMTGSGKSEFIITYILSLAVNFHPDEVAFILIDYKGGGLTGAFEDSDRGIKLPHLAGTITNLDGAAVKRSLISIQSELRHRQAVFNEARKISNEGTMDIYKYQQLYREKIVKEPVPHLFIISDEFAELKTQQPEFMDQLVSAARIGRSLGVHLILATQKPSGVVDDQIWSNSKFRVCLKVQEKADSMDMIKCPDAAELSQTGRFYLQVGFNELFALGQSAWCGAKYVPTESVERHMDSTIQVVDNLGRVIKEVKPLEKTKKDVNASKTKQIVSIVKYLSDLAKEENIVERPLWLDAIKPLIYIKDLEEKYKNQIITDDINIVLNPIVGEYDDPFNQRQNLLTIPLSQEGNCIVYGATGNGKATFLTTLIYSLIKNHDATTLNIYIMDFGAETLRAFAKAPQVGNVLLSFESEKMINFFKMLHAELEERKKMFADYGGEYNSYCHSSGNIVPNIVVILNGFAGFSEQYEDLVENFTYLSREGLKYGIIFVTTTSTTNSIRYKTLQNFKQLLTMQLNDQGDYPTIVGKTDGLLPSQFKGRGLINIDRVYEFQTAHSAQCADQYEFIREFCAELQKNATVFAKEVAILPDVVDISSVKKQKFDLTDIPIGIVKKTLEVCKININSKYIFPVLSQETSQLYHFAEAFALLVSGINDEVTVFDAEESFENPEKENYTYISGEFENHICDLFNIIVERNNCYKDAKMNLQSLAPYKTKVVIIIGINRLFAHLSEDSKEKLSLLLEKGEAIYKVHFVIIESVSQFAKYNCDQWYKNHVKGADGIWIGDGFVDQYVLKSTKVTNKLYDEIGDEFGYNLNKGRLILTKLLAAKT